MFHEAKQLAPQITTWRRHLHAHPELSGHETETAKFVARQLHVLGLRPQTDFGDGHGIVCDLAADRPGPAIALRADLDALPITEQTGLPFASRNPGVMHACGHDAHTAMLLGAAHLLANRQPDLPRPVRLLFQPHEENFPGGAKPMIDAGALDGVAAAFGLHITSWLPINHFGLRIGPFMAAVSNLRITVHGLGGHAAQPEECIDPIVVASNIVLALQSVVSRNLGLTEQAVLSITRINGGTADNVIASDVQLTGTIRTFDLTVRDRISTRVREIATNIAAAHGARADVQITHGYPVLENHPATTRWVEQRVRAMQLENLLLAEMAPQGGGEDFAYFSQHVPSTFAFLGARNDAKQCNFPHHHPRFNIDEDALPIGSAILAHIASSPELPNA